MLNYIGVEYCGFAPSDSGVYINSYPGIEFANIDQIANADEVSWSGVWANVQQRAVNKFRLDVLGELTGFGKRYRLREITQCVDLGQVLTAGQTQAPSSNNSGLVISLLNPTDDSICSNMQSLYVQSVQFYMVNYGSATVTVKDADFGTVLGTYTFTNVYPGWQAWKIDQQFDGVRRLSITVNTSALTTAYLDLSQFDLDDNQGANYFSNTYGWNNSGLWFNYDCTGTAIVQGIQMDSNFLNPKTGENTFGVSCVFSVKCTYNNIVCNNKRHFLNAWGLCLCIELLTERIYTSRINRWTTVDKEQARSLRLEFERQYRGGESKDGLKYEGELRKACGNIDLDLSDCCIECDAPIQWKETQM